MSLMTSEKASSLQQEEAEQSELPQSQSSSDFSPSAVDTGLSKIRSLFGIGATTSSATMLMQNSVLSQTEQAVASLCRPPLVPSMTYDSSSCSLALGASAKKCWTFSLFG
jgi:hypothetical protein